MNARVCVYVRAHAFVFVRPCLAEAKWGVCSKYTQLLQLLGRRVHRHFGLCQQREPVHARLAAARRCRAYSVRRTCSHSG